MPCKKRKPYDSRNRFNIPKKTTTPEGKREYMRLYMRAKRMSVAEIIGLKRKRR